PAGGSRGAARAAGRPRGGGAQAARARAPDGRALHRRPRLRLAEDLRPRGLAPRPERLPRDLELLVVRRLPGAPREDPLPPRAERQASFGAHAQRLGPGDRPHARGHPRAEPAGGRLRARPRSPARVHERPGAHPGSVIPAIDILERVALAPRTTLELGGPARFYLVARDEATVVAGVRWARLRGLRVGILGGGSNLVVSDEGFDGLVIEMAMTGVEEEREGDRVLVTAAAGEEWDALVE